MMKHTSSSEKIYKSDIKLNEHLQAWALMLVPGRFIYFVPNSLI
jgi:hypothetical protein